MNLCFFLFFAFCPRLWIVQGSEGGTGAAPPEFSNSIGTPLVEGLVLVDDLLRGAGLRENVKIICSGKVCGALDRTWESRVRGMG